MMGTRSEDPTEIVNTRSINDFQSSRPLFQIRSSSEGTPQNHRWIDQSDEVYVLEKGASAHVGKVNG